jgi:hypothetical protein
MTFDKQIDIYQRTTPSSTTQNEFGEHELPGILVCKTQAEVVFKSGGEKLEAAARTATTIKSFRIRYRNLTTVHYLVCDSETYNILSIQEEGRKYCLILECEKKQ